MPVGSQKSLLVTWAHSSSKVWVPLEIPTALIELAGECSNTDLSLDLDVLSSPRAEEEVTQDQGLALSVLDWACSPAVAVAAAVVAAAVGIGWQLALAQRHPKAVKTKDQLGANVGRSQKLGVVGCSGHS